MKNYFQRYLLYLSYKTKDEKSLNENISKKKYLVKFYPRLTPKWGPGFLITPYGFSG